ncbi:putative SPC24 Outer kinetochore protein-part of Ndc80p complex [Venustampulla echinocandica]|uniref:Kinetochore protein Spc24 n=1 Tax=Venustampulla echinocandica TaxID=2656787 RepID=A0A370TJR0_9HELO|nr:putative SPC24 Outer kinetochore protein-part of Ndc80p complex [Venustampulla echinocandica]RDL35749.1 putative SPC24 Outer kinetochore protein-part of Ndc80p complex [Venustampulla echinocandica]
MLLDEDPATLIHHTISNFNIQPDKLAVARINDSLSTLQQARDLRAREAESALKKLSRTLNSLNNHHRETITSHTARDHASEIATLDTQKFRIAKSASDLEIESERLASQLADMQARLQELDLQGNEGGDDVRRSLVQDEISLKLRVFRGLGIDIERDKSVEGAGYNKVIVRNGKKGDVHVVHLDGKFSRFFYANYFWNTV